MRINVSEPPQKKLHKVPEEDVASSTIGSGSGEISVIRKPDDIAAIHCSAMHKGKGPLSSAMISTTEKITSTIGSTSSCSKFPIHESASHLIPYRGSTSKLHPGTSLFSSSSRSLVHYFLRPKYMVSHKSIIIINWNIYLNDGGSMAL